MTQVTKADGSRVYKRKDREYPSVTSIIKIGLNKPALNNWVFKNIAEHVMKHPEIVALPFAEGVKTLLSLGVENRDAAGAIGTSVHNEADHQSKGTTNKTIIPEEALPFIDVYGQFIADYKPIPLVAEATVFSEKYGYGGTIDAIYQIGDKLYACDLKTGKRVYEEVALQLAAYRHADYMVIGRREVEMPRTDGGLVLHLRPEGYKAKKVKSGAEVFDSFLAIFDVYNWIQEYSKWVWGDDLDKPV